MINKGTAKSTLGNRGEGDTFGDRPRVVTKWTDSIFKWPTTSLCDGDLFHSGVAVRGVERDEGLESELVGD